MDGQVKAEAKMGRHSQLNDSSKRRRSRRRRWTLRSVKHVIERMVEKTGNVLVAPIKILFKLPSSLIGLFHERGVHVENSSRRKHRKRTNAVNKVLSFPIKILLLPATLFTLAVRRRKQKELLFLIPALSVLLLLGFVWYQNAFRSSALQQKYLARTRRAVDSNDLILARTYFARILQDEENLTDAQSLHWSIILGRTGEREKAEQILDRLAPDNRVGYEPGHRTKAINLVSKYQEDSQPLDTEQLKFHLENSGTPDSEIKQAWAAYYEVCGQPEKAIQLLNEAAESYPALYLSVAKLAERTKQDEVREDALTNARLEFKRRLVSQPLDISSRVMLARVLLEMENYAEAQRVLQVGLRLQPSPVLKRSLSNLYVILYEKGVVKNEIELQVGLLKQAINADLESPAPYERLVQMTQLNSTGSNFDELESKFQEILSGLNSSAIDHVNLAHLYHQKSDPDQANWHLGQAWRIDPQFGSKAYRLGLGFAKSKTNADSDWALILNQEAIKNAPKEPAYKESLAEIYLIRKEFGDAIKTLESVLDQSDNSTGVHERLAYAYREIGEFGKSDMHARLANTRYELATQE